MITIENARHFPNHGLLGALDISKSFWQVLYKAANNDTRSRALPKDTSTLHWLQAEAMCSTITRSVVVKHVYPEYDGYPHCGAIRFDIAGEIYSSCDCQEAHPLTLDNHKKPVVTVIHNDMSRWRRGLVSV